MSQTTLIGLTTTVGLFLIITSAIPIFNRQADLLTYIGLVLGILHIIYAVVKYKMKRKAD